MTEEYTAEQAVAAIEHYLNSLLGDPDFDPHVSTLKHLNEMLRICKSTIANIKLNDPNCSLEINVQDDTDNTIIVGCDGSVDANPGTCGSAGWCIDFPDKNPIDGARILPKAITNNLAEYGAIYCALEELKTIHMSSVHSAKTIEIQTDSQLVVKQLTGEWGCNDEKLRAKRDLILEEIQELEKSTLTKVIIKWYPRCSTKPLKQANKRAQQILGVKPH